MTEYDVYKVIESKTDRILFTYRKRGDATNMALQVFFATGKKVHVVDTKGNEIYSKR